MKKPTQNRSLLNLVKHVDFNNAANQNLIAPLFDILSNALTAVGPSKWSKEKHAVLEEKIRQKPELQKFADRDVKEGKAEYLVVKKSNSAFAERLTEFGKVSMDLTGSDQIGPLITDNGISQWLEFYKLQRAITVSHGNNSTPLIYATVAVPLTNYSKPILKKIGTNFQIGSAYSLTIGTIWISASLFKIGEPADRYIGFRISQGVLAFPIATSIEQNDIQVSTATKFSLSLLLDHSSDTIPQPESVGLDAYDMELQLCKNINLHFTAQNILAIESQDENRLKIYGKSYTFNLGNGAVLRHPKFNNLCVALLPVESSIFEIAARKSLNNIIDGEADIENAHWFFHQRTIQPKKPTVLSSNGSLSISLGSGLSFYWKGLTYLDQYIKLTKPMLAAGLGEFQIIDTEANFLQQSETFKLWQAQAPYYNSMTLSFAQKKAFTYLCYARAEEGVGVNANTDFQLDKPFQADGTPISPSIPNCVYVKMDRHDKTSIMVYGPDNIDDAIARDQYLASHQFAINNAFFSTSATTQIYLTATCDETNQLTSGNLNFYFELLHLEPILPHPYAYNNVYRKFETIRGRLKSYENPVALQCVCAWSYEETAWVDINFTIPKINPAIESLWFQKNQPSDETGDEKEKGFEFDYPNIRAMGALLDVSTQADYLGIALVNGGDRDVQNLAVANVSTSHSNEVTINRMFLEAPMVRLIGLTLPQVSWEPYCNATPAEVIGDGVDPQVGIYNFTASSEPTIFHQSNSDTVAIDPMSYMQRFKENLKPSDSANESNVRSTEVFMSLPHGKLSMAQLSPFDPEKLTLNQRQYDVIQPYFAVSSVAGDNKAKGGWQFRIAADSQGPLSPPKLDGWAYQLSNAKRMASSNLESPLGNTPHQIFQNVFSQGHGGVPITHLDFSGYGASTYSNWKDPQAKYATVGQVKFDLLRGRVAHEIVQVASVIYPWGISVTRTISFYKRNSAIIYREDSGWVATSEGIFDFSYQNETDFHESKYEIHPGHIQGLFKIRNIKEITAEVDTFNAGPTSKFIAVTFDADVKMEHISSANDDGKVAGWGFKGYLQLLPTNAPVSDVDFAELFRRKQNNIGGNVDAIMKLAGGGQLLKVKRVDMSVTPQGQFVAAARGTVLLPADGSWSVVQFDKQTQEVSPIANKQSVPVYKTGERDRYHHNFSIIDEDKLSKITSPEALFDEYGSPQYGYLQNTVTQKLLFPNPFYHIDKPEQLLSDATKLADSFTLMNSKGIFPNIGKTINAEGPGTSTTEIVANGLKKVINRTIDDRGEFDIIGVQGGPFRIYVEYKASPRDESSVTDTILNYATDSQNVDDAWKNHLSDMSIHVDMGPFKPIMTISGNFSAKSGARAEIEAGANAPQLKLPPTLDKIYQILEFLDSLDFTNALNNVEAVKKGIQVAMSNSADAWDYKFKAEKEIPFVKFPFDPVNYNAPTTPLKLDASFKMGCYFNMPIKVPHAIDQLTPSVGAFLELSADIRVMCVSLAAATIYAKGSTTVGLAADMNNLPALYFKFGFGVELCVGLPVIGSVSLTYLAAVDMSIKADDFIVGAYLYFRGRVELAFGMVEVAISIEAAGKIEKPDNGPCSVIASVTFALDICVAFVIDLDFTKTWTEQRQIA